MKTKQYISPVAEVHEIQQANHVISTSGEGPSASWMFNPGLSGAPEQRGIDYYYQ